jgi:hypothetical protein
LLHWAARPITSSMACEIRPADLPSLDYICLNLRKRDAQECYGIRGHENPFRLARQAIDEAGLSWVFAIKGEPIAYLGITQGPIGLQAASFGTDKWPLIGRNITAFARHIVIPSLYLQGWDACEAYSMAGYFPAHRWLKLLGARPEGYASINNRLFIRFVWRRTNVHVNAKTKEGARAAVSPG